MKKTFALFLLLIAGISAHAQNTLKLVPSESKLVWRGFVVLTFGDGHYGVIDGITGSVTTGSDGKIQKGQFALDMNTIKVSDMQSDQGRNDLANHLKSEDFFDVLNYPQGSFSILSATYSESNAVATIDGILTLKGITNKISFPVTVESDGKSLRTRGKLTIDRTRWNVNHQSPSIITNLKDNTISDSVIIELDLKFK